MGAHLREQRAAGARGRGSPPNLSVLGALAARKVSGHVGPQTAVLKAGIFPDSPQCVYRASVHVMGL